MKEKRRYEVFKNGALAIVIYRNPDSGFVNINIVECFKGTEDDPVYTGRALRLTFQDDKNTLLKVIE